MASWMVHLRIAEELLPHLEQIEETVFVRDTSKWIRERISGEGIRRQTAEPARTAPFS